MWPFKNNRIFFCYSRAHERAVADFAQILGIQQPVFLDQNSIKPGEKWQKKIDKAIDRCGNFYLFWCAHASKSPQVRHEWQLALKRRRRIIPFRLCNCALPAELKSLQAPLLSSNLCGCVDYQVGDAGHSLVVTQAEQKAALVSVKKVVSLIAAGEVSTRRIDNATHDEARQRLQDDELLNNYAKLLVFVQRSFSSE